MIKLWYVKDVKKNCIDYDWKMLYRTKENCQNAINKFAFTPEGKYVPAEWEIPDECFVSDNQCYATAGMVVLRQFIDINKIELFANSNFEGLYSSSNLNFGEEFWSNTNNYIWDGADVGGRHKYLIMSKEYFDKHYGIIKLTNKED